jgi:hypothetical protein
MINRRDWIKTAAVAPLAAGSIIAMEGCSAKAWMDVALADLPTILKIVTAILQMAGKATPANLALINKLGADVSKDLQLAETLIAEYKSAPAADLLQRIDVALNTAEANLSAILTEFHVMNPVLQATVSAALGSAITIVLAIEALLPKPPVIVVGEKALPNQHEEIHGAKNGTPVMLAAFNLITKDTPQYRIF